MKTNLKWTKGNSKLKKLGTIGFGIPAYESQNGFKTCPQAGACAGICYARQGTFTWPVVRAAREYNLALTQKDNFTLLAISDLKRMRNVKTVRIHDSGDFYSQDYLNAWIGIALAFPTIRFYAYTKSLDLDFSCLPDNLGIIQSQGGKLDHLIDMTKSHARIFSTQEGRKSAGYQDGTETDKLAINGHVKIGLVYHGVKNLTPTQNQFFI